MTDTYSSDKPAFDPAQPFEAVAQTKPPFDPSKPFEEKPDIGRVKSAVLGAFQGGTFNFGDELAGLHAAGPEGLPSHIGPIPVRHLIGLARLGYEHFTSPGGATKSYESARDAVRADIKTAEEQHPGYYTGGQVVGSLAAPGGAALQGATRGARILRGAGVGAGSGLLSGAGEGETPEDRGIKAAVGTAIGGTIGAVAPPLVEGAGRLVSAAVSKPVNMIRAAINPEGAAEGAIGRAAADAERADPAALNRLTQQELTPGSPATVMDTLGQPGRNLARSAGNISGEARDVLNQTLDPRFEGQVPRLVNWLQNTFHFPDALAQQEAIQQAAQTANRPAYRQAYDASRRSQTALWDDDLEQLAQAPVVQNAIRLATPQLRNWAVLDGYRPPVGAFVINNGRTTLRETGSGNTVLPSLQYWDYVKRGLDGINTPESRQFAHILRTKLDDMTSDASGNSLYRNARAGAAQFFGAENALEAGQRFVTENFAVPQTRQALGRMSPQERQLFQDGFVSRFVETLSKIPDRADVVRRVYNSPEAQQKIEMALGPQRAHELEAMLRVENIMQQSLRAVQGNSTTVMQLASAGLAGAGGGGWLGYDPTASGLAAALATAGKHGIDQRVARHVAEMLTSHDPQVLQRGVARVAGNSRLMDALRAADTRLARIGSQQVPKPGVSAIPAIGVSRADKDEPEIPRPSDE